MKNKQRIMAGLVKGMTGSALLMISDWLMGACGKDNVTNGVVQSNWAKAAAWRYEAAMLIASIALFFLVAGIHEMIHLMKLSRNKRDPWSLRAVRLFELGATATMISELFLHMKGCVLPILYRKLYSTSLMESDMFTVVDDVFFYISIPFYIFAILVVVCTSVPYMYQVFQGRLRVPKWFMLLNPMVLWLVGWVLRLFKVYVITDFTACMVSFGFLLMLWGFLQHVIRSPEARRE